MIAGFNRVADLARRRNVWPAIISRARKRAFMVPASVQVDCLTVSQNKGAKLMQAVEAAIILQGQDLISNVLWYPRSILNVDMNLPSVGLLFSELSAATRKFSVDNEGFIPA